MNIKHPEFLYLLLLIPLFIGFFAYVWKKRTAALLKLCDKSQLRRLFPASSKSKILFRYFLLTLVFILFLVSFISPRWGYDWKEIETKGANIYIAVDVSQSMLAEDISPNRLSRAKIEIQKLLDKLTGDQIGLIIFAGESFLQSPLTHDYLMIKDWVREIQADSIPVKGTSIKSAIEEAMRGFSYVDSESKALIIISDGEEQDEKTMDLAYRAKSQGIKIYTIGIGTDDGSPIPTDGGLVKDSNGEVIVSKLDDEMLKKIAEATYGYYVRSSTGDFHLDTLYYEHIKREVAPEILKSGKTKLWYETYQIFSGVALLLLILELLFGLDWRGALRYKSRRKKTAVEKQLEESTTRLKTKAKAQAVLSIFLLLFSLSLLAPRQFVLSAQANILDIDLLKGDQAAQSLKHEEAKDHYLKAQVKDPTNPRLNYNLGISHYRSGDYERAMHSFNYGTQAESDLLREKSFHNLGNSFFRMEKYREAIKAYEEALKIIPDDEDAKYNLELAKKKLQEEQEDEDKEEEDQEKEQEQDKNQDQDEADQGDQDEDQQDQDKDKEDQQDQNKDQKDQKDKQDQKNQEQKQQEQEDQKRKQQAESILRQVPEASSNEANEKRKQAIPAAPPSSRLNPW